MQQAYTGYVPAFLSPAAVQAISLTKAIVEEASMAVSTSVRILMELIEALDRRVPQVQRAGESAIAREASQLRARATARLAEIERGARATGAARAGVER